MTPLTVGMWHEMQPVAGLTGQIVACGASVNALPPLKWCSFWANPSLDEFSAQGPVSTPWTRMDPLVFSRLRRAAPGDLQRPCGCAWSGPTPRRGGETGRMVENVSRRARSVDVFQQGRFLFPCQLLTSPYQRANPSVSRAGPFALAYGGICHLCFVRIIEINHRLQGPEGDDESRSSWVCERSKCEAWRNLQAKKEDEVPLF